MCVQLLQLCPALRDSTDCSLPGSSVNGILQARILEWVPMPTSWGSSWPRDWTHVSCITGRFFTTEPPRDKPNRYHIKKVIKANTISDGTNWHHMLLMGCNKKSTPGLPCAPVAEPLSHSAGRLDSTAGQGIRSHMLQPRPGTVKLN